MKSWHCEFIFYGDDRSDALESRIIAALQVEGLDFDPMTVNVEKISENEISGHEVRPDGPETEKGGLIGQQPY